MPVLTPKPDVIPVAEPPNRTSLPEHFKFNSGRPIVSITSPGVALILNFYYLVIN